MIVLQKPHVQLSKSGLYCALIGAWQDTKSCIEVPLSSKLPVRFKDGEEQVEDDDDHLYTSAMRNILWTARDRFWLTSTNRDSIPDGL